MQIEAVYIGDEKRGAQSSSLPTAFYFKIHNIVSRHLWMYFSFSFSAMLHIVSIRRDQKKRVLSTSASHRQRGGETRNEKTEFRSFLSVSLRLLVHRQSFRSQAGVIGSFRRFQRSKSIASFLNTDLDSEDVD